MPAISRSPLLFLWLVFVLIAGLGYSFAVRSSSLLPGQSLMVVGVALIMLGGVLGSARTGKWFTWDGRVIPNRIEWFFGLTGAVLFVSPFLHVLLLFLLQVVGAKSP
ncbi:MAG: hypothetical protein HYV17_06760 [Xanthomonadales bacterium]|nr:hypothetical protein [Xanthomonadales bacterium]